MKGHEQLDSESSDKSNWNALEIVAFNEFVQVHAQKFETED